MFELNHLPFFCLIMAILSIWIHRSIVLLGSFLLISYILALHTHVAQPFSLVPIGALFVIFLALKQSIQSSLRFGLAALAVVIAAGLNFHWLPFFNNWHVDGRFSINYDTPFIGFFALTFLIPILRSPQEWSKMSMKAVPLTLLTVIILAVLTLSSHTVAWQFKIPSHFIIRIVSNLFLVVIPEEAFFRGFVQEELYKGLGPGIKGYVGGIAGASLLFTLFHIGWATSPAILAFVFVAGVFYGAIYQYVRAIESSIICHFVVNFLHMTCFTYHAE